MIMDGSLLLPEWIALGALLLMLLGEMFIKNFSAGKAVVTSLLGAVLIIFASLSLAGITKSTFHGAFLLDDFAVFFKVFFGFAFFGVVLMSREYASVLRKPGEYFLILWCSLIGFLFLVSANDLLLLFISLEIVTLSFYILSAYLRTNVLSIEAGLKYLIIGSVASAMMIYGISLVFLAVGSAALPDIRIFYAATGSTPALLMGLLLIISGAGFKVASVPFHLWVPDVYEGAPAPTVAFLSIASKAAGFAVLIRVLFTVFMPFAAERAVLFSLLAVMTLLYGNLGALKQTNIKRLFGYSSIGHAGYLLIAIACGSKFALTSFFYYLMAYGVSNLAAFLVITIMTRHDESANLESYHGLSKRSPVLAGVFFIALLSLAGIPPLAGFFGKFLVLLAAVREGITWLALIGALAVAVSLFYYLSIIKRMYVDEPASDTPITFDGASKIFLIFAALMIVVMGVWQAPFMAIADFAASALF